MAERYNAKAFRTTAGGGGQPARMWFSAKARTAPQYWARQMSYACRGAPAQLTAPHPQPPCGTVRRHAFARRHDRLWRPGSRREAGGPQNPKHRGRGSALVGR